MQWHVYGGRKTTCRHWFSPCIIWSLVMEEVKAGGKPPHPLRHLANPRVPILDVISAIDIFHLCGIDEMSIQRQRY